MLKRESTNLTVPIYYKRLMITLTQAAGEELQVKSSPVNSTHNGIGCGENVFYCNGYSAGPLQDARDSVNAKGVNATANINAQGDCKDQTQTIWTEPSGAKTGPQTADERIGTVRRNTFNSWPEKKERTLQQRIPIKV